MDEQEKIDTLMRVLDGFNRNDIDAAAEGLDPDVTYIVRGRASVSGTYRGRDAMASVLRRIKELTRGTMAGKPEVVLAKGDEIMMYMRVTGSRTDASTTTTKRICTGSETASSWRDRRFPSTSMRSRSSSRRDHVDSDVGNRVGRPPIRRLRSSATWAYTRRRWRSGFRAERSRCSG